VLHEDKQTLCTGTVPFQGRFCLLFGLAKFRQWLAPPLFLVLTYFFEGVELIPP